MTSKYAVSNTCTGQRYNLILLNHHLVTLMFSCLTIPPLHKFSPFRVYPLIQTHAYSIHLIHRSVEMCLEVPMRSEALLYVARPSVLRVKLDGFEVVDVLWVEEHVSYRGGLTVQFEGMSREDYTFGDDSCRVWVEE